MKSLKQKIMIPVLIVAIIGITTMSFAAYLQVEEMLDNDIEKITKEKVEKLTISTEAWIHEWKEKIDLLSTLDVVKKMDHIGMKKYVKENERLFKDFEAIALSDTHGAFKSTTGNTGDISGRDYFPKVMSGDMAVSEPILSKDTGLPIVFIAAPIKNNKEEVIGLIGGSINLTIITDIVNAEKIGDTGYAYMLNSEGVVIAHPNSEFILKKNIFENEEESLANIVKKMLDGKEGMDYYRYQGENKIAAYGSLEPTGWSIAMSVNYSELNSVIDSFRIVMILIGFITLVLIILIIYLIVNRSIKPLISMIDITKKVSKGNLKVRVDVRSKDEIGFVANNFNEMVESMNSLIKEVTDMGKTVTMASQEMLASSEEASKVSEQVATTISELAEGANEQAKLTQEGNGMVNELVNGITTITHNAGISQKAAVDAMKTVDEGIKIQEYQKSKTTESIEATRTVGGQISDLYQKSQKIGQIVKLISSIAKQTNLLALNAAIEAARAGEQGKGFAVVAEEIRELAEQSSIATKDIGLLIGEIKSGVDKAVKEMNRTEAIVNEQNNASEKSSDAFKHILTAVEAVISNIKEVANASENLNSNSLLVGKAIENVASITEENAAGTEEVAASTQEQSTAIELISTSSKALAELSVKLETIIQRFTI